VGLIGLSLLEYMFYENYGIFTLLVLRNYILRDELLEGRILKINDTVNIKSDKKEYLFNGYGKIQVSPTSLRYVYQSHLILSYFKTLTLPKQLNLVEIGGGYGGLCVAIYFFSSYYKIKIDNYIIIDLKEVTQLQETFHKTVGIKENIQYKIINIRPH
jgi:hypothetical protein